MCVCVEEEEEESYFHKRVGQIRDLNFTMLRRRLALKSFLTKTPFEALLPLQLIALAKYVSYTLSLSLSLSHTHTHNRTFGIHNGVTGHQHSSLENLHFSKSSNTTTNLISEVIHPNHHSNLDEFRRSAIRRLYLQSEYADKATTFLTRNRTRQMHEISRHEILSQCPYVVHTLSFSPSPSSFLGPQKLETIHSKGKP